MKKSDWKHRKERLNNWWYYHRLHVLLAVGAAVIGAFLISQAVGQATPDYHIAWVGTQTLSDEQVEKLERQFANWGTDQNQDGKVLVQLHQYCVDLRQDGAISSDDDYVAYTALDADLSSGQSVLFLLEDPASFEAYTQALLYLDGAVPADGADDWENMVISVEEIPALAALAGENDWYLGLRGSGTVRQEKEMEKDHLLWETMRNSAS